jgi:hypothetical protein
MANLTIDLSSMRELGNTTKRASNMANFSEIYLWVMPKTYKMFFGKYFYTPSDMAIF